jgi:hypothetical protein
MSNKKNETTNENPFQISKIKNKPIKININDNIIAKIDIESLDKKNLNDSLSNIIF